MNGNAVLNDAGQTVAMVFAREDGICIRFQGFSFGPLANRLSLDMGVPEELHINLQPDPKPRPPR